MTTIYFVRHAQSDYTVRDPMTRPLTEKGRNDCRLVTEFLSDKGIEAVCSSPFKRAVDTVADFAEKNSFQIHIVEDFQEQKTGSGVKRDLRDTHQFSDNPELCSHLKRQWADFDYTLSDGETLGEVQRRNIAALEDLLRQYEGKTVAVGTHGTALSTMINYYDSTYGFDDFMAMIDITPWVVRMDFNGTDFVQMEKIDLFA